MPTLMTIESDRSTLPSRSPNCRSLTRYSPMAPDTTAKLKIVLAKSYRDQATGTRAWPLGVRPRSPPGRAVTPLVAGPLGAAASVTAR